LSYRLENKALMMMLLFLLLGCSSVSPILEPVESEAPQIETPRAPSFDKVMQLLQGLGYEGVGLELEDENTLQFVFSVFSNEKAQKRKIRFVYTGLQLSFDKEQSSLTLGENTNLKQTLRFIEKNIPFRD
jgi:hypothetical protein